MRPPTTLWRECRARMIAANTSAKMAPARRSMTKPKIIPLDVDATPGEVKGRAIAASQLTLTQPAPRPMRRMASFATMPMTPPQRALVHKFLLKMHPSGASICLLRRCLFVYGGSLPG